MQVPNFNPNQFVSPIINRKEIELAEKVDMMKSLDEANASLQKQIEETIESANSAKIEAKKARNMAILSLWLAAISITFAVGIGIAQIVIAWQALSFTLK